jgi:hypothetical protein
VRESRRVAEHLRHPLLTAMQIRHGFGVIGAADPPDLVRPRQVHGAAVATLRDDGRLGTAEADGVVSAQPGRPIGIVTADCVPLLLASPGGACVAAVHAGWRGLAAGVVARSAEALAALAGVAVPSLVAVIGPHIGPCCYEVDAPVIDALSVRLGDAVEGETQPTRPGHARIDLAALAALDLARAGLASASTGRIEGACTRCDPARFHSYRRDGERAGRLVHFITARQSASSVQA